MPDTAVKTPQKRKSLPSTQDSDLRQDVDRSDKTKEDNEVEDMMRVPPKDGPPRLDLRKPKIIDAALKVLEGASDQQQLVLSLRPLYTEALIQQDKEAQDMLFKTLMGLGQFQGFKKSYVAPIQGVYVGGGLEKTAFSRVVGEVEPTAVYAHVTAMATVDLEDDGYQIKPDSSKYINTNGDAWERQLVIDTAESYIEDALNYIEHVQVPYFAKGQPVDYILKDVGNALYLDLLIEVNDTETQESVVSGEFNATSVGCSYGAAACSRCGKVFAPSDERCSHLQYHIKQTFKDSNGVDRVVAEVLRAKDGDIAWTDISWVNNPAFKPAVLHDLLIPGSKEASRKVQLHDLITISNATLTSFMIPFIRREQSATKRAFYLAATYYVLRSGLTFLKKAILLRLLTKWPVPTVTGTLLYFRRLFSAAGVDKQKTDMANVVRGVRNQLT